MFFEKHLKFIHLNDKPVPFTKMDMSYLLRVSLLALGQFLHEYNVLTAAAPLQNKYLKTPSYRSE